MYSEICWKSRWNSSYVECWGYCTLGLCDVGDVWCWGCEMLGMWDVRDVGCSWCGIFEMWDVRGMGCSGCEMFGMWDVRDVRCSGCGMFGMWDVQDVRCSGCGMFGMFAGMWYVDLQNASSRMCNNVFHDWRSIRNCFRFFARKVLWMSSYDLACVVRVAKVHNRNVFDRTACSTILFCSI